MPSTLQFGPAALAAGVARTATIQGAPASLLTALRTSALLELQHMIAPIGSLALSSNLQYLADTQRTLLGARIGAGVTDLLMNTLGYAWRDNAASLATSGGTHPDFIYGGGNARGFGVVLAEAHGSFSSQTSGALISRRAISKYQRQVTPHIIGTSTHGPVIHGYSVAVGARTGYPGSYLHVAETHIKKQRRPIAKTPPATSIRIRQSVPVQFALATHRSNFALMDDYSVVEAIDALQGDDRHASQTVESLFVRLEDSSRAYLASASSLLPPWWSLQQKLRLAADYRFPDYPYLFPWWRDVPGELMRHPLGGWFVIEESACEKFLNVLTELLAGGIARISTLELPDQPIHGFGASGMAEMDNESRYLGAQFRDGLAILNTLPSRVAFRTWSPADGLSEPSLGL